MEQWAAKVLAERQFSSKLRRLPVDLPRSRFALLGLALLGILGIVAVPLLSWVGWRLFVG